MRPWAKAAIIVGLTFAPISLVAIYGLLQKSGDSDAGPAASYKEIDWRLLRELDYQTGQKSPELEAVNGKPVKIPGFVVPLDDNAAAASEFLLVPSPQACIHVPPPPPNQMVMVRMKGKPPQRSWGPVWIEGRLFISTQDSQYGKISFMMTGEAAEPYRMPEDG